MKIKIACILLVLLMLPSAVNADGTSVSITTTLNGSPMIVSASDYYAGAIYSITWNGAEFLSQTDRGRQLQSSFSFDDLGGCYNPTEAGSRADGNNPTSSSVLYSMTAEGATIRTSSRMAYWMAPGPNTYNPRCGYTHRAPTEQASAYNTTQLSDTYLEKRVSLNYGGDPHVIEYTLTVNLGRAYSSVLFEPLTAHLLNADFPDFWQYDPIDNSIQALDAGDVANRYGTYDPETYDPVVDQFVSLPVIASSADGSRAIAIYSPDQLDRYAGPWYGDWEYGLRPLGYGRWDFTWSVNPTTKIGLYYRGGTTPAGRYSFRQFVIIGSLQEVADSIGYLAMTEVPAVTRGAAARLIDLAFGSDYAPPGSPTFADVPLGSPYYFDIEQFYADGITGGCAINPRLFCPNRLMTRGEVATFLLRKVGEHVSTNQTPYFYDVPASYPLFGWIQRFYELGVTQGCALNPLRFCPNEPTLLADVRKYISDLR